MKKLLFLGICCCMVFNAMAQTPLKTITIKGVTVDSLSKKPLSYVTVALLDGTTKQSVKGGLTKDDGSFELTANGGKPYQVVFASVGYANKAIPVTATTGVIDLGKIILSVSGKQLNEVTITAVKPVMKQEVDRISYDVQADPESKAITALDMMRKVPLLSVDASDNIKLKGSGNYKILVNGKESALVAKNPSDVLRSMPATNIERIEVITTPPAKYDAEGLAGIINIITKKNADQGYNANVSARYNSIWGPGLNLSGSLKQGKFGLSLFTGINHRNNTTSFSGNEQIFTNHSAISQDGMNSRNGKNKYLFAELSYEIDSLDLLTGSVDAYRGNNNQTGNQLSRSLDSLGALSQQYSQATSGYDTWQGTDISMNYQRGFKKNKDQLLTLSYKYSYSPNSDYSSNLFSERFNYLQSVQPDFNQYNNAGSREHTVQVDYAQPFKKITLEAGGKAILRNNFSDFQRSDLDLASQQYILNPLFTDDFNYHQDVYSLYNSYQLKLDKWTGKAGLRLENTVINADFTSVNAKVNQNYTNLIPSVSIQRTFKTSSINFGFTQRIQRPGVEQLNPFVDNSNPKFISTGNPNLRPELNNSFELTYSNFAKSSINAGLSYSFSNNSIQNVTSLKVDSLNNKPLDTVTTTTFQNLGSNRTLGFNLSTNFTIVKNLTLNLNGQVSEIYLKGTYNGQSYKNNGLTGNAFGNLGYKFGTGYRAGLDAGFFSGDITLQGRSSNFIFNSYVLTKEFLNKKATISLVASNPYSKYHTSTSTTTTQQFYQRSFNENPYRNFAVRVNYKFGRLNSEIKRNQHGINNDDTKGGSKNSSGS